MMGKTRIADILVTRDRISHKDALERVNHCSQRLYDEAVPTGDSELAEDIIAEELGLEMDYLIDIL